MTSEQRPTLAGPYELNVDPKDRLQIPAQFRRVFEADRSQRLYGIPGSDGNLWLYGETVYDEIAAKRGEPTLEPTDQEADFSRQYFGHALFLPWDTQGRITLPGRVRDQYGLSKEIVMVGMRDHVELYDRPIWKALVDQLVERNKKKREAMHIKAGIRPAIVGTNPPEAPAGPKSI